MSPPKIFNLGPDQSKIEFDIQFADPKKKPAHVILEQEGGRIFVAVDAVDGDKGKSTEKFFGVASVVVDPSKKTKIVLDPNMETLTLSQPGSEKKLKPTRIFIDSLRGSRLQRHAPVSYWNTPYLAYRAVQQLFDLLGLEETEQKTKQSEDANLFLLWLLKEIQGVDVNLTKDQETQAVCFFKRNGFLDKNGHIEPEVVQVFLSHVLVGKDKEKATLDFALLGVRRNFW